MNNLPSSLLVGAALIAVGAVIAVGALVDRGPESPEQGRTPTAQRGEDEPRDRVADRSLGGRGDGGRARRRGRQPAQPAAGGFVPPTFGFVPPSFGFFPGFTFTFPDYGAAFLAALAQQQGRGVQGADLEIEVTDSPARVEAGEDVRYEIRVRNRGPLEAEDVLVQDDISGNGQFVAVSGGCGRAAGGIKCALGRIRSGGRETVTVRVRTRRAGTISNVASVTSGTLDHRPQNNVAKEVTRVDRRRPSRNVADLVVTKSDSADPVSVGDQFSYAIAVVNRGPDTAGRSGVVDSLPAAVRFVSASAECGGGAGGTVVCEFGRLGAGEERTVTITVEALEPGTVTNTVRAFSDARERTPDDNIAREQTTIEESEATASKTDLAADRPEPTDLAVGQSSSTELATVDEPFDYSIEARNEGDAPAGSVQVVDTLPANVRVTSASPECGAPAGGTLSCDLGTLAPGASRSVMITVVPAGEGTVTNAARITSDGNDPNPANDSASLTTNVQSAEEEPEESPEEIAPESPVAEEPPADSPPGSGEADRDPSGPDSNPGGGGPAGPDKGGNPSPTPPNVPDPGGGAVPNPGGGDVPAPPGSDEVPAPPPDEPAPEPDPPPSDDSGGGGSAEPLSEAEPGSS